MMRTGALADTGKGTSLVYLVVFSFKGDARKWLKYLMFFGRLSRARGQGSPEVTPGDAAVTAAGIVDLVSIKQVSVSGLEFRWVTPMKTNGGTVGEHVGIRVHRVASVSPDPLPADRAEGQKLI
jgi:hypothetical protein